jgi:hypothetical protein
VAAGVIVGAVMLITTYRARPQAARVEVEGPAPKALSAAGGLRAERAPSPVLAAASEEGEAAEEDVAVVAS